ncbi:MAG: SufD family Fe-S cluster assembly protein [Methanomassiliicoccales archaeon]|jgi:Fe-S cluster assembly scaffold protein SufB|nr:SufD family Fe-S cluster assembly protein [Methanomassiliicoccales archaeon]
MQDSSSDLRKRAEAAKRKRAAYGEDIDLEDYDIAPKNSPETDNLENLDNEIKRTLLNAGVVPTGEGRAGSFLLLDNAVVHRSQKEESVEVMSTQQALKKYDWVNDYYWKAIPPDTDKYTATTFLENADGYFIRALPGAKARMPVQTCLLLGSRNAAQTVHNIVIVEEGAELEVVTGCATKPGVEKALHLGISEFYIKKGGKLTFTMIHNWAEQVGVRPRTVVIVGEEATYVNNYVCLKPVKSIQMYPTAKLEGRGSFGRFNTVAIAHPGSEIDIGSKVVLSAPNARAEIVSRSITTGGKSIARGRLVGEAPGIRAHLECKGLILQEKGIQLAIPELEASVPDVEMTHEAAVGKIAKDQVEYIMARGLSEAEAVGIIVRGFLEVGIRGIPEELKKEIDKAIAATELSSG